MFQLEFARTIHAERVRDIEQRAHHRRLLEAAKELIPMYHDLVAGADDRTASPATGPPSPSTARRPPWAESPRRGPAGATASDVFTCGEALGAVPVVEVDDPPGARDDALADLDGREHFDA